MADNILNKISQLPEDIQDYLFSEEIAKRNLEIINKYKFSQKEKGAYFNIINKIFLKELSFSSLPAVLMSDLKIDDDRVIKQLTQDIKDIVLSPVKEYLGMDGEGKQKGYEENILIDKAVKKFNLFSVASAVIPSGAQAESRDLTTSKKQTGKISPLSPKTELGRNDKDIEKLKKKFSSIADTFLSNVRTKAQFKSTLIKPVMDGGLGMEKQTADDVAEFLASYSRLEPVIAKSEEKKKLDSRLRGNDTKMVPPKLPPLEKGDRGGFINPPHPSLSEGGSSRLVPPNVKIEVSFEKEEKEAAAKKPKIEKMRIAAPKLLSVTEGVQSALAELNYNFPSSELQDRLKSIIDARVRNVRTSIQTFDKLTQDVPSGGLGFSKLEADKVSLVLNKYLEDKNKDIYGSKLAEIKQAEDEEKRKNEERARVAEDAEKKNFDERFTKMTGKTPPPLSVIPAKDRIQSELPPSEKGDRGGFINPPQPSFSKGGSGRPAPSIPNPKSSIVNQKSEISPPRPVLEDIKFTPKLAGPTEEIARLTADDFRKLSHDPKEAVLKIKDKLALLRGESYKKYQTGIDAWRNSPLYGEYLKIINKSLSLGVSLDDALSASKTLTKDEFDAIIESKIGD